MSVVPNSEEQSQCAFCLTIWAADSVKPNKPKRQLEAKHSEMKNKTEESFRRKVGESHPAKEFC
jgi:hypothetical protein